MSRNDVLDKKIKTQVDSVPRTRLGLLSDLMQKLTGRHASAWMKFLARFLRMEENPWDILPTWRRVCIGGGQDHVFLTEQMKQQGMTVSDCLVEALAHSPLSKEEIELELVKASLPDLGLSRKSSIYDIYKRIRAMGYDLCPAEVGPRLRLEYQPHEYKDGLTIISDPFFLDGRPYLWSLVTDRGKHYLISDKFSPRYEDEILVFCRRQKKVV